MNILIIEDSKIYQKVIKNKIEDSLFFAKCDIVSSYKELKTVNKNYDLYICDYFLGDSEGEHVYELLNENKDVILLTKNDNLFYNKELIDKLLDYVIKDNDYMFDYLIKFIKRLKKNRYIKILVVEDSLSIRKLEKKILEKLKFSVLEAKDANEAVEILKKEDIDLLITDLIMPDMNGVELIKYVKKNYDNLPIIVVSSAEDNKLFIKSIKLGANDFIKKPFKKDELVIRVNNLLEFFDTFKKINEKLQKDALTDVYNRHFLENHLDTIFNKYDKKSIAILDIDFFKKINDTYGHQKGDEILKDFANKIKNTIRKSDIVIRYGGEEFLIFMPNTSKEEAMIVLLKIKNAIKNSEFNYTFSAGIANEGKNLSEMIKIADERLYKSKNSGRDKITIK